MERPAFRRRIEKTQDRMKREDFDGLIIIKPENVRYTSGLWGYSTRPEYAQPRRLIAVVLPSSGDPILIVPKIESLYARRATWLADVRHHVEWEQAGEVYGGLALLGHVLKEKSLLHRHLGIEASFVSVRVQQMMQDECPGSTFDDASTIMAEIRMVKDRDEIRALRVAGEMAVQEYRAEARALKPGVRECEVALRGREIGSRHYAQALRDGGDRLLPDSPMVDGMQIITSGERLDMPHAWASSRVIRKGDVVLLDFCRFVQYEGYRVGFARMAALRKLSRDEQHMFKVTLEAFDRAVELLRPGVRAEEPELRAREILAREGLAETFVHRTGRGVGLENAELPEIREGDKTELKPGMVVTIEPSIYFSGFAVHVEDTFLITMNGAEVLTRTTRGIRFV